MAVDFTYTSGTDIRRVRFLLSDTRADGGDGKGPAFTDTEITDALTDGGSVDGAMPALLTAMLMDRARRARTFVRGEDGADPDDRTAVQTLQELLTLYTSGAKAKRTVRVGSLGRGPSDPLPYGARGGCR